MPNPVLTVKNLKKYFPITKGALMGKTVGHVKAVDEIDFQIEQGETFALVGESGCGKTTTSKLILKLYDPTGGDIWFGEQNIAGFKSDQLKEYRKQVQAVFQDPWSSFNPRMRVGSLVGEPLLVNNFGTKEKIRERVTETLQQVGFKRDVQNLYIHEFSGGQRQRIALARALVLRPRLIVLDEPVSALDVSIQAQVMNLLKDLQEELGVSYLLIAHGLNTVRYMCHQMGVMYLGKIVEQAGGEELFENPLHPYTKALFSAALPSHPDIVREEIVLPGEVPSPVNVPSGCRFHTRCSEAKEICSQQAPPFVDKGNGHFVACHMV